MSSDTVTPLKLNCWVLGGNSTFSVEIDRSEDVGGLKEAIKEKKKVAFDRIDADSLEVWNVSVPINEDTNLEEQVKGLRLHEKKPLWTLKGLLKIFSDLDKETLHVVVKAPPIIVNAEWLRFNCLVLGDDPSHLFPVEIAITMTVGGLKEVIKDKKNQTFGKSDADDLVLWKVSVLSDRNLKANLDNLRSSLVVDDGSSHVPTQPPNEELRSLLPMRTLLEIFPEPPTEKHVHIIIQPPTRSVRSQDNLEEKEDIIAALRTRREKAVKKGRNAKTPSEAAKSKQYLAHQRNEPIYDGRYDAKQPVETTAPPIQLFHPVFGHFMDDLSSDSPIPPEIFKATIDYMKAASAIYEGEEIGKDILQPLLSRILGAALSTVVNSDKTHSDGVVLITLTEKICETVIPLLLERKNEFGNGSCDPSIQAGLSAVRFWVQSEHNIVRDNSSCPTFLLATAGPWFALLGLVFTDKWIVQRLTDFIWVGLDSTLNEPHYHRVARVFYSLRTNMERLRQYYVELEVVPVGPKDLHPCHFPTICAYRDEHNLNKVVQFRYIEPLEVDSTCATFLATPTTDTQKLVVIKFVQRYGEEAHRLLAKESLAPQLIYYGKIGVLEGDPSYGHLRMVVMEYIEGETLDNVTQISPRVMGEIRHALYLLHGQGYVFGDLRRPNVMITDTGEVKLIDFDWAGVHGKSRYPLLISPNLAWPEGVEGLSIMETWHDDDMLTRLLPEQ